MSSTPNIQRLSRLKGVTRENIGKRIQYCSNCDWQLDPGWMSVHECPECRETKMNSVLIDKDLYEIVNHCELNSEPFWRHELNRVDQCPQRQDSTAEQLSDLREIATKFGFYDAADYLRDLHKK